MADAGSCVVERVELGGSGGTSSGAAFATRTVLAGARGACGELDTKGPSPRNARLNAPSGLVRVRCLSIWRLDLQVGPLVVGVHRRMLCLCACLCEHLSSPMARSQGGCFAMDACLSFHQNAQRWCMLLKKVETRRMHWHLAGVRRDQLCIVGGGGIWARGPHQSGHRWGS